MEETTKVGLAAGGAVALIGAICSYLCFKQGEVSGYKKCLIEDAHPWKDKYASLLERYEETQRQIEQLKELKRIVESERDNDRAETIKILSYLWDKHLIDGAEFNRFLQTQDGGINEIRQKVDVVINAEEEAAKILNGQQGRGIVDLSLLRNNIWRCVGIVFTDKVKGIYRWPRIETAILPDDDTISLYPNVQAKIKEFLPKWNMDAGSRSEDKQGYDYACVCETALQGMDHRTVLCDGISYDDAQVRNGDFGEYSPTVDPNDRACYLHKMTLQMNEHAYAVADGSMLNGRKNFIDEYGVITSSQLDGYIRQSCAQVREMIAAQVREEASKPPTMSDDIRIRELRMEKAQRDMNDRLWREIGRRGSWFENLK